MKRRPIFTVMIFLAFFLPACQPAGNPAFEVTTINTSTTDTTQKPSSTATKRPTETLNPTPTATPTYTTTTVPMPHIRVVYADEGSFWAYEPPASPLPLQKEPLGISGDSFHPYAVMLSSDGERIIFLNAGYPGLGNEIHAVHFDGNSPQILLSREQINKMESDMYDYPFETLIEDISWIPHTHRLLFTTAGPATHHTAFSSNEDLFTLDADTGQWVRLLKRGEGGNAIPSPNGKRIAIRKPYALSINSADGPFFFRNLIPESATSAPLDRMSVVWSSDSALLGFILRGTEQYAVYAADGISGDVSILGYIPRYRRTILSPTLRHVGVSSPQETSLYTVDGTPLLHLVAEPACFLSFAPDGQHFAFSLGNPPDTFSSACLVNDTKSPVFLGSLEGEFTQIPEPIHPEDFFWINNAQYIFIDNHDLILGDIGGDMTKIAALSGHITAFDVVDLDFQAERVA